jgi:hypothetical protein
MGYCDANHFGTMPMRKLLTTSLICLAVSATAAHAQGPGALNVVKQAPGIIRIIRPSAALTHEIVTASRFSTALLGRQPHVTQSLIKGTDPATVMQMFAANSSALTVSLAGRTAAPALPTLAAATKEAKVTISVLDGKVKIGELGRIGSVVFKGGDLDVFKLTAFGGVAAVAYCNYISCSEPVPSEAELNVQEAVEAEDDEPTPAQAKTPSNSTGKMK